MSILSARIIQVKFNDYDTKSYAYFTDDASISVGDFVAVVTPNNREQGVAVFGAATEEGGAPVMLGYPKIACVSSTTETVQGVEMVREWVVGKLDLESYAKRRETEERRKILNAKIKRAVEDAKRELDVSDLAARSPALAELLKQRENLV